MDFGFDATTEDYRKRLLAFMDEHVYPAEAVGAVDGWSPPPVLAGCRPPRGAPACGTCLPAHGRPDQRPVRAARRDHRPQPGHRAGRAELRRPGHRQHGGAGRVRQPAQQETWLRPLLAGEIRSAFAMTEPQVASSDATNIGTRIARDGDDYVINGRKFYISGAMNPNCAIFIVMGKTDPDAPRHLQQSMVLVPRDTPGLTVGAGMTCSGTTTPTTAGHAEVIFDHVRVPATNLIGEEGSGFAISQARLGPGRIHHCMRLIGMAERASS
jgi:acyl-CoA dehydrogenase